MTLSFLVTRRELSLGAQDSVTGWYAKTFTETASYDKIVIVPKGFNLSALGVGSYAKYTTTGIICAPLFEDDEIIAGGKYYEVASVEDVDYADSHLWYMCELHELQMHWDMPTYGTGATVNDPRYQLKILLDANLSAANMKEYDGSTSATYITCWANPPYPLKRVFDSKGVDLVYSIGIGDSKALPGHNKTPFGYSEKVPIEVGAVDKTTVHGENMMWQGVQEVRRITKENPLGSIRGLEVMKSTTKQLGSLTLHSVNCVVDYTRGLT
jgi:hypothetical protein